MHINKASVAVNQISEAKLSMLYILPCAGPISPLVFLFSMRFNRTQILLISISKMSNKSFLIGTVPCIYPSGFPKQRELSLRIAWRKQLEASGANISSLVSSLRKPLCSLRISQKTIWLNEVPEYISWDFTPIVLVSASSSGRTTSEFRWNYISGAGEDEESWARGYCQTFCGVMGGDLINSGPELCNQKVADILEKDRVHRAQRGQNAPQLSVKPSKFRQHSSCFC